MAFYERIPFSPGEEGGDWESSFLIPKTRLEVQQQTIQYTKEFQYFAHSLAESTENNTPSSWFRIKLNEDIILKSIQDNEMLHDLEIPPPISPNNGYQTKIYVDHHDCIDCAINFLINNPEFHGCVMLLNLANPSKPGGGWQSGAKAQEEQLFRRSNYWQHIATSEYDPDRIWSYPIPQFGGIFSPNVIFFRHSEENSTEFGGPYAFMSTPHQINCLAVAACQWPPLVDDIVRNEQVLHPDYELITKKKIETILSIALKKNQKVLILGAFGCGAFQNPPQHIARLFHEVIMTSFPNFFHTIIFSVYTVGAAAIRYNYDAFLDIFGDINGNGKNCLRKQDSEREEMSTEQNLSLESSNRCNIQ